MSTLLIAIIVLVIITIILIIAERVLDVKSTHDKYDYPIFVCDRLLMGGGCNHDCKNCKWRRNYN